MIKKSFITLTPGATLAHPDVNRPGHGQGLDLPSLQGDVSPGPYLKSKSYFYTCTREILQKGWDSTVDLQIKICFVKKSVLSGADLNYGSARRSTVMIPLLQ